MYPILCNLILKFKYVPNFKDCAKCFTSFQINGKCTWTQTKTALYMPYRRIFENFVLLNINNQLRRCDLYKSCYSPHVMWLGSKYDVTKVLDIVVNICKKDLKQFARLKFFLFKQCCFSIYMCNLSFKLNSPYIPA